MSAKLRLVHLPARQQGKTFLAQLLASGYRPTYRAGSPCQCPGCGGSNWWLGRTSAECAFCGTALPYAGDRR